MACALISGSALALAAARQQSTVTDCKNAICKNLYGINSLSGKHQMPWTSWGLLHHGLRVLELLLRLINSHHLQISFANTATCPHSSRKSVAMHASLDVPSQY